MNEVSALIRAQDRGPCALLCKGTKRRQPSVNQESGPDQELNHAGT